MRNSRWRTGIQTAAALLATVVLAGPVAAQQGGTDEDVIVTATRLRDAAPDIPASVSTLSGTELRRTSARNVDDAMRAAPGVTVLRSVGMGYGLPVQINVRGVPGQHAVLLLVDGLPLNEAVSDYASVNEIPMETVRKVELVRGPYSALYGANAFGGVMNILTRNPSGSPSVDTILRAGNGGFLEGGVWAATGSEAGGATVSLNTRRIDDYLQQDEVIEQGQDPTTGAPIDVRRPADNYDYEDMRLLGKVMVDVGDKSHIDLHVRRFSSDLGYGTRDVRPLYPEPTENRIETETSMLGSVFRSSLTPRLQLKGRAAMTWQERNAFSLELVDPTDPPPIFTPARSNTEARDGLIDLALDFALADRHTLTLGADYQRTDADFSPLKSEQTARPLPLSSGRKAHVYTLGAYLQDRVDFGNRVSLVAGVRLDDHSAFGSEISPKAGILFHLDERTSMRASVGRAYRAPSLSELYQPRVFFGNIAFESNPDLEPESIVSADAGFDHRLGDGITVQADVFYNDMRDLISKRVEGNTLQYANTDEAWSAGIEAALTWDLAEYGQAAISYTEQQSENRDTGYDLEHIPDRLLAVKLTLEQAVTESWTATLSLMENYIGERGYVDTFSGQWVNLDAYWRTDGALRFSRGEALSIGFTVENATDETYREWSVINPAPGRLYAAELGLSW